MLFISMLSVMTKYSACVFLTNDWARERKTEEYSLYKVRQKIRSVIFQLPTAVLIRLMALMFDLIEIERTVGRQLTV